MIREVWVRTYRDLSTMRGHVVTLVQTLKTMRISRQWWKTHNVGWILGQRRRRYGSTVIKHGANVWCLLGGLLVSYRNIFLNLHYHLPLIISSKPEVNFPQTCHLNSGVATTSRWQLNIEKPWTGPTDQNKNKLFKVGDHSIISLHAAQRIPML